MALTIDDTPSQHTNQILDVLMAHGVSATFFVIGSQVPGREGALKKVVRNGSELGNHAMHDEPSKSLSDVTLSRQILEVQEIICAICSGMEKDAPPCYFRPGSGVFTTGMRALVSKMGYLLVLGDVYPHDAQVPFWRLNSWHIQSMVRPGSIIVCHDRSWTIPMLKRLLPELKRQGYEIVTLTGLLKEVND